MDKQTTRQPSINLNFRTVAAGAVISVVLFLITLDLFRQYESEEAILVIAKSPATAIRQDEIMKNVASFPKMLSFYDRLLQDNPDVTDKVAGKSADARKKAWDSVVSIRENKSRKTMLTLTTSGRTANEAQIFAQKTARTLIKTTSLYYNRDTDLDIRIIDGPFTHPVVHGWGLLLLLSAIVGFGISILISQLRIFQKCADVANSDMFKKVSLGTMLKWNKRDVSTDKKDLETLYVSEDENYINETLATVARKENVQEIDEIVQAQKPKQSSAPASSYPGAYPNYPEMPQRSRPSAGAPSNLPVAEYPEDAGFGTAETVNFGQAAVEEKKYPHEIKDSEPTDEQVRERLNKLLRGDL